MDRVRNFGLSGILNLLSGKPLGTMKIKFRRPHSTRLAEDKARKNQTPGQYLAARTGVRPVLAVFYD